MRTALYALIGAALLSAPAFAAKEDPDARKRQELDNLRRELSSLEGIQAEKLEALEKKEAQRWDMRYRQSARAKESEERARSLEEKYGRLAGELGRLEEELVKARNEAKDKADEAAAAQGTWNALGNSLKRAVDGAAQSVASDFPVGMEDRTLRLSRAGEALAAGSAQPAKAQGGAAAGSSGPGHAAVRSALEDYLGASLSRLDLTSRQQLETRQSIFGDGRPATALRLQLGTVFVGELEKGGQGASQILLRTGNLEGRTFVWRSDLAGEYNRDLAAAVRAASEGKGQAALPLDVLQFKSMGSGFVKGEEETFLKSFTTWFKAGGVTLYPLFAVGIIAFLMILERLIYFARKNTDARAFMANFQALADRGRWQEALQLCEKNGSSLARTLGAIAANADKDRGTAEKAVREALLKEIPALEKRLPLIAAMGAAAPLLGLLGTVSGLVTLFKVLNQLGANDPKVLAGGISEALINTETGLAIAIPVLLVHGFLNEKLDTITATVNGRSLEVLNKLWPKG